MFKCETKNCPNFKEEGCNICSTCHAWLRWLKKFDERRAIKKRKNKFSVARTA